MSYHRGTSFNGKPCTELQGGLITVSFISHKDDDIFVDAMLANRHDENIRIKDHREWRRNYKLIDGKIVFYKEDDIELFQYNFKDAVIVYFQEQFDKLNSMHVTMVISPAIQDYRFRSNMKWTEKSPTRFVKYAWEENWIGQDNISKIKENNSKKENTLDTVKVVAHFRPSTNWNGDKYGFDWIRIGDSGLVGDTGNSYENILGHHYITPTGGTKRLATDKEINYRLSTFEQEQVQFDNYKNNFISTIIPWKLDSSGNPTEYHIPWLSILRIPTTHKNYDATKPDPVIDLSLIIEIQTTPERIKIKYNNKYFDIHTLGGTTEKDNSISYLILPNSAKSIGIQKINLTLKNKHTIPKDIKIEVLAEEKQPTGDIIDKSVGKVIVVGNSKKYRKKTKILLVNVKTNTTGVDKEGLIPSNVNSIETMLSKFLNQALIIPEYKNEALDLRNNVAFNTKYLDTNQTPPIFVPKVIHDELDKAFFYDDPINPRIKNPTKIKYENYFRIYFIGEACSSGAYGEAKAIPSDTCIVYCDGLTDTTAAHELYHSMGLYHSFSNLGTFTFDYGKTDCIMDYSDIAIPALPVIQFYKWQWEILWKNPKIKKE